MEILYIKTENVMLSLSGDATKAKKNTIKIVGNECISHSENAFLYTDKEYEITVVNLQKSDITVLVNEVKINVLYLMGGGKIGIGKAEFTKTGINNVKIFSDGKLCASIGIEAYPKTSVHEKHFCGMKRRISEIAENELLNFLIKSCEKHAVAFDKESKSVYEMLCGIYESFNRMLEKAIQKKKYTGLLKKLVFGERHMLKQVDKYKRINAYDTKENRMIKYTADRLCELTAKISKACVYKAEEIDELRKNLKASLEESALCEVEAKEENCRNKKLAKLCEFARETKISGSFITEDASHIRQMYKFYCFAEINSILKGLYLTIEDKIFKADENVFEADIYKKRALKYVNTENDNVLTVYLGGEEYPIILKIEKKDRNTSHRRVYAFECVYSKNAGERESNRAYAYLSKLKGTKSGLPVVFGTYALCRSAQDGYENLIEFLPENIQRFEVLIKDIAGDKDLNEYPPFEDVILKDISKEDFDRRDVMVAVVKTRSQFNTNIKGKFYYIPAHFIEEGSDIKYVALYQSKTLFGKDAGIKYFGEVEKMSLVPRYKISEISKNSDEMYFRFDIKNWQTLDEAIKPKDFAQVCMFTNMFLLKTAKELPELYIASYTEYILYCVFEKIKDNEEINFMLLGTYFKCRKESVTVYLKSGETAKIHRKKENLRYVAYEIDRLLEG